MCLAVLGSVNSSAHGLVELASLDRLLGLPSATLGLHRAPLPSLQLQRLPTERTSPGPAY